MNHSIINVLHFGCPYLPYQGGSTSRLSSLVNGYHDSELLNLFLITPTLKEKDSDDYPFKKVLRKQNANRIYYDNQIKKFIKDGCIDIVVIHNSRALLKWLLFYKFIFPKIKIICEIHSFRDETRIKRIINKFSHKLCDKIVVLSNGSKKLLSDKYNITSSDVIYNGFETIQNGKTIQDYNPENGVVFSYIGSFHSWQGVLTICDAIEELYHEGFWERNKINLVGGGVLFNEVKKRLSTIKCNNISLVGWVGKNDVADIMTKSHFLLAPRLSTIATESVVPLKVVESIQFAKPLICSPVGGLLELLPKSDNVALFMDDCEKKSLIKIMKTLPSVSDYYHIQNNLIRKRDKIPTWIESSRKYDELFRRIVD